MKSFLKAKAQKFIEDTSGVVAPIFGLMAIVLFLAMGAAVDYSRWMHARNQTITAMDAAVLAAGKALQNGDSSTTALTAADSFYNTNKSNLITNDTIQFSVGDDGTSITASGNAEVITPFLRLAHIDSLPVLANTGVDHSKSQLAVGGNAETNLEIALVLDVTGSMSGDKLDDMKAAAKSLINIVVWSDQSEYTSRVSLIPFSQAVNVGSTYFTAMTSYATNSTLVELESAPKAPTFFDRVMRTALAGVGSIATVANAAVGGNGNSKGNDDGGGSGGSGSTTTYYTPCVVERLGSNPQSDSAPASGSYIGVYDIKKQDHWLSGSSCKPSSVAMEPLTSNKTTLNDKIDDFVASGYTAGHIGIQVGWYTLSPNWSSVWGSGSTPASYSDEDTKKIAILMTDGDFNTYYNSGQGDSGQQAEALCTAMKTNGITIYTVAFDVDDNSDAAEVMQNCATDAGSYYDAENGEELQQAFRDIALRISDLRLTH